MLPSKGYFTNIRCLFYDAGSCDRPYCHFRHSKKGSLQDEEHEYITTGAKILEKKIGPIKNFENVVSEVIQDIHLNSKPHQEQQATYSPTPITQLKNQNGENTRRHLPIHNTPYRPPIRPIKTNATSTSSLLKFHYDSPNDSDTDKLNSVQYIPTQNLSTLTVSTAHSYTPTSTGTRNGSSTESTKAKYIPTEPNTKPKSRKFQQYVPTSQSFDGKSIGITYQPTDISSIICNSNLDYSPNLTNDSKTDITEHTYNPTKQATDSLLPSITPEVEIGELDTDLDFITDILNDVQNDEELNESNTKKSSSKDRKSSTHHKSSSSSSSSKKDSSKKDHKSSSSSSKKDPKKDLSKKDSSSKKESSSKSSSSKENSSRKSSTESLSKKDESSKKGSKTDSSSKKESNSSSKKDSENSKKESDSLTKKDSDTSSKKKESDNTSSSSKKDSDSSRKHSDKKESSSRNHSSSSNKDKKESSSSSSKKKSSSSSSHHHSSSKSSSSKSSSSSSKPSKHDRSPKHKTNSKSSSHHSNSSSSHHHSSSKSKSSSSHSSSSSKSKSKSSSSSKVDTDKNANDTEAAAGEKLHQLPVANFIDYDDVDFSSDDDIEEQCRRIFEDSVNMPSVPKVTKRPSDPPNVEDEAPTKKQRVAHPSAITSSTRGVKSAKPNYHAESSKLLLERYKISYRMYQSNQSVNLPVENSQSNKEIPEKSKVIRPVNAQLVMAAPPTVTGKVRIAHVPNVSNLMNAKLKIPNVAVKKTVPQTIAKGKTRIMHAPSQEVAADRPTVKDPENTKIPFHVRAIFLNNMIDACLDMYAQADDAYERARAEEFTVFDKCRSLPVYKQSAKLCVHRLQNQAKQGTIDNSMGGKPSTSKIQSRRETFEDNMYGQLVKYILPEEQLWLHGFPRPHPQIMTNGAAIVNAPHKPPIHMNDLEKICCRCHKIYKINEYGYPQFPEECIYHYKRRYQIRGESRYGCCSSSDDLGCISAPLHVFDDIDYNNLRGYVETMNLNDDGDEDDSNRDYGVYALDCEMSYTTAGIELTRVTVIDRRCEVVYETVVKPFHPIVDYNTRFSGIEASHMEGVTTTLLDVQANLLHMFNSRTILIGHSLESDFKALKLIHNTVVDTSIMFPHRLGPPFKRALKNLAFDYLSKIIQNQVSGHDSAEDANACMELVIWKLNEDKKS